MPSVTSLSARGALIGNYHTSLPQDFLQLYLRLYNSFAISGTAFWWICSYIRGRSQLSMLASPHLHIKLFKWSAPEP